MSLACTCDFFRVSVYLCSSGTRGAFTARGNGTLVSLVSSSVLPAVCQYDWMCPPGHGCDVTRLTKVKCPEPSVRLLSKKRVVYLCTALLNAGPVFCRDVQLQRHLPDLSSGTVQRVFWSDGMHVMPDGDCVLKTRHGIP
jgi:hypothetical protein